MEFLSLINFFFLIILEKKTYTKINNYKKNLLISLFHKNRNRQSQKRPYLTRQSECCNDQHDNQTPCQRKIRRRHEQTNCIRGHLIQNKNKSINFDSKHIKNQRRLSKSNPNRINEIGSNICDLRNKFVRNNSESKIFITSKNREISSTLSLRNKNSDSILQRHLGSFDSKRSTSGKRIRTYTDPSQYCRPIREGNRTVYEHPLTLQKTNYQKNLVVKPSTLRRASSSSFIYLGNHKAKKDILFEEFSQFLKKRSNNMANIQNNPVRTTYNSPQIQPVLDFMNNRKAYSNSYLNSKLINSKQHYRENTDNNNIDKYLYKKVSKEEKNISDDIIPNQNYIISVKDEIHQVQPENNSYLVDMWHNRGLGNTVFPTSISQPSNATVNHHVIQIPAEHHSNNVNKPSKKYRLRSCGKNMKNIWLTIKYTVLIGVVIGLSVMAYNYDGQSVHPLDRTFTDMIMMTLQIWLVSLVAWVKSILLHPAFYFSILGVLLLVLFYKSIVIYHQKKKNTAQIKKKSMEDARRQFGLEYERFLKQQHQKQPQEQCIFDGTSRPSQLTIANMSPKMGAIDLPIGFSGGPPIIREVESNNTINKTGFLEPPNSSVVQNLAISCPNSPDKNSQKSIKSKKSSGQISWTDNITKNKIIKSNDGKKIRTEQRSSTRTVIRNLSDVGKNSGNDRLNNEFSLV